MPLVVESEFAPDGVLNAAWIIHAVFKKDVD